MIRVKLLPEPEYQAMRQQNECEEYEEYQFFDLLRKKGTFTDDESCALLRHLHGEAAVTERWYARETADGRSCLPAISQEAKYGLVVIENSRHGRYTNLDTAFTEFELEKRMGDSYRNRSVPMVWDAFASMDMDILLVFQKKQFSFGAGDIPLNNEFILENYPIGGVPTEVRVVDDYRQELELRDGEWRIRNSFYDLRYHWYDELDDLLKNIWEGTPAWIPMVRGEFSLDDFEEMYYGRELCDYSVFSQMREEREEAKCQGIPYEPSANDWRIFNHMGYLPREPDSRRVLYLIIQRHPDGRYVLRDKTSAKYPSYGEMLGDIMNFAAHLVKKGCEMTVLPVDVNEVMRCAQEIHKAVCAFRISGNVIETFDAAEGLQVFAATLREARDSGQCSVSRKSSEPD